MSKNQIHHKMTIAEFGGRRIILARLSIDSLDLYNIPLQ